MRNFWAGIMKDERFKLRHFVQGVQPIIEREPFRGLPHLEGSQALGRHLPIDAVAVKLKAREVGGGAVEKSIRDNRC
jgi:hypothetical protein